jgi:hypothetical protein
MDIALKLANEDLEKYREKMEEKFSTTKRKFTKFSPGNWVYLKKDQDNVAKGTSRKLDEQSQGPYKVISVDNRKSNVTIQLAANENITVKNNKLRMSKVQDIFLDPTKIRPSKLNEIIVLDSIPEIEKLKNSKTKTNKNKKQLQIPEGVVGKRIKILWKSGQYKGWHNATVIGYNADKTKNLVYYDIRDEDVDPTIDYYAHNLQHGSGEEWVLI